ncbi:MAG: HD domain-containing protein [Bacteroidota bacterium]
MMYTTIFEALKDRFIKLLKENLKSGLSYHNIDHTLDVVSQAEKIARMEGIDDEETIFYLKVAALSHDSGFIEVYNNHEEKSVEILKAEIQGFNIPEEKLQLIADLIMATKMPQNPHNHLEEVLCDADLDYLGRDDFFEISDRLRDELLGFGIVKNELGWDKIQIAFFESHKYFTKTSQHLRNEGKQQKLIMLKKRLSLYTSV